MTLGLAMPPRLDLDAPRIPTSSMSEATLLRGYSSTTTYECACGEPFSIDPSQPTAVQVAQYTDHRDGRRHGAWWDERED